jgi:hypothetical protein
MSMDREQRLDLMDKLCADNETARARAEERRRRREEEPALMQDFILSDPSITKDAGGLMYTEPTRSEPAGALYVRQTDSRGMLYRPARENAAADAAAAAAVPSSETDDSSALWNAWLRGHLNIERTVISQAMGEVIVATRREMRQERDAALLARDREISALQGELREVKGLLRDTLEKLGKLETDLKAETNMRDGLVSALELQFVELRGRVSGVLRDFIS